MSIFGSRLKALRDENNLTQTQLSKNLGLAFSTISMYERGVREPKFETLEIIADYFNVTIDYLLGKTNIPNSAAELMLPTNIIPMPKMRKIPLLGTIACGEPILAQENIEGDVSVPDDIKADFALRCKGDSMIDANIYDGDIVYIKQQPIVNNGEIAAVLIGEEATLKRFYQSGETITLMPCNTALKPLVYTGMQFEEISILGKATYYLSRVR